MNKKLWLIFVTSLLVHALGAFFLPVIQDEAYYIGWSRHLQWGYFDHPPMAAWLAVLSRLEMGNIFLARLLAVVASSLLFPFCLSLFRRAGLKGSAALAVAMILVSFNFCGLVFGVLTTPDVVLIVAWAAALNEALAAIRDNPKRWITAGIAVGIGLTSKYVMLLIGPVFLWTLWRAKRPQLLMPWPYVGGLMCLLCFTPHLYWNYQHDWITFKFQMNRGMKHSHATDQSFSNGFPTPEVAAPGSNEEKFSSYFTDPDDLPTVKPVRSEFARLLQRVAEYAGAQLLVWGAWSLPLGYLILRRRRDQDPEVNPEARTLLLAATWVPLLVFGIISFKSKIEANWPAVYMIGAAALLAGWFKKYPRLLVGGALLNTLLLAAVVVHAHIPLREKSPKKDRILRETHGYEALAASLRDVTGPLFGETYQLVSMVNFYAPHQAIGQWPGLTRNSEFVRDMIWQPLTYEEVRAQKFFWLLTSEQIIASIPGYQAKEMLELRDCLKAGLIVTRADFAQPFDPPCKKAFVHRWFLVKYER